MKTRVVIAIRGGVRHFALRKKRENKIRRHFRDLHSRPSHSRLLDRPGVSVHRKTRGNIRNKQTQADSLGARNSDAKESLVHFLESDV